MLINAWGVIHTNFFQKERSVFQTISTTFDTNENTPCSCCKNGLRTAAVASRLAAADITVGDVLRTSSQRVAKKLTVNSTGIPVSTPGLQGTSSIIGTEVRVVCAVR